MNFPSRPAFSLFATKFLAAFTLFGSLTLASGCGIERHTEAMTATAAVEPSPEGQKYELRLHHLHTGESIDVVYRIGDAYVPAAIDELNHFLRDHRTEAASHYDPKEFDTLHAVLAKLNRPDATIDIVCGYRTPWSNNFLRTRGGHVKPKVTGVAEHSQHMLAKAIDIRVPGVNTRTLRDAALSLHAGGVGYYPTSQFVHVDVGPVRQWSFGGRHSREG
ncbi:DUF882 domain-containing protein [Granulicella cerasi]|uniref:Murein endopeptidase K n=1 Tax=Granulicella cerasi TaxID=741063 RepID=A0ABW1Z8V9_9BACT|nr:DUF882 domain-containing protein [Granulicella cerasi]